MNALPESRKSESLPEGVMLEKPVFVPRLVMTPELQAVVREVLNQWKNRKAFAGLVKYGIRPLDRLLFYGPPGNGKTMACSWIGRELGVPVYRALCNQLHGGYLGDTEKAIAGVLDYFNARTEPALLLWDEVESIFLDRKHGGRSSADRAVASATAIMLQSLDRWKSPVLMVMATNLPDQLDPALLSRVEMRLEFSGPDESQCEQMIAYWSELLHEHGGAEWGPVLAERFRESPPVSFRAAQQTIAFAAREWTAAKFRK